MAIAASFDERGERGRIGPQLLELGSLRFRYIGRNTNGFDRHSLFGFFVKAERTGTARQRRQQLHSLHDPPDQCDIAVKMPGRLANDDVQLGAAAAVDIIVAPRTHHAVAVHHPGATELQIPGSGKTIDESGLRRIGIRVRQRSERQSP